MQIIKRASTLEVEKISNGFLVILNGRDANQDYINEKIFVENLNKVIEVSDQYFKLLPC